MDPDVIDFLLSYFGARTPHPLERNWLPTVSIAELGLGQADVVLALLRTADPRFRRWAEFLVGRRFTICRPCLRPSAPLYLGDERHPDRRRVTYVARNPRLPTTMAFYRFAILREGMTIQQFLVRGGRRGDVRLALQRGWIQLEGRS